MQKTYKLRALIELTNFYNKRCSTTMQHLFWWNYEKNNARQNTQIMLYYWCPTPIIIFAWMAEHVLAFNTSNIQIMVMLTWSIALSNIIHRLCRFTPNPLNFSFAAVLFQFIVFIFIDAEIKRNNYRWRLRLHEYLIHFAT